MTYRKKYSIIGFLLTTSLSTYNCSTEHTPQPSSTPLDMTTDVQNTKKDLSIYDLLPQQQNETVSIKDTTSTLEIDSPTSTDLFLPKDATTQDSQEYDLFDNITKTETLSPNTCKIIEGKIYISDTNLATALYKELSLPLNKGIDAETAKSITKLSLTTAKIKDLTGLECFIGLQKLNLTNNEINSLDPLQYLQELKTLYLPVNKIASLDRLTGLYKLQDLDLSDNNKLSDIAPLASVTSLQELDLEYNSVTNVTPLGNLPKLQKVFLGDNPIIYNPTACQAMKTLQKQGTWVSGFDFGKCPN